eukprot:TRINITY_DN279_c0_g2_i2.p1 TRINITY_DN279_c0_g2~~TRINITY_DN279_c0_g2_i2.p1  ORF type:complete len:631 (+),score=140.38 TRINITY_DN279_c0_g2_i2:35-1927(+)
MEAKYVKIKVVGQGAFGKCWMAKLRSPTTAQERALLLAMKEVNVASMSLKEQNEARHEVQVLSMLNHPNIISCKDSGLENGKLYIVMDFAEKGDLANKIKDQKGALFSENTVLDWFVQICLALKHMHDKKVLHRDIKTQNIFLTSTNMVKLGDFGISRVLRNTLECAKTAVGTPYYLSPEICQSRPYNNKTDVWSLACVLYELLTFRHPFEANDMKGLIQKILRGTYTPLPSHYSRDVSSLMQEMFQLDPKKRPSINAILKKPFIQDRIQKFLSSTVLELEFPGEYAPRPTAGEGVKASPAPAPLYTPSAPQAQAVNYGAKPVARPSVAAGPSPAIANQIYKPSIAAARPLVANAPADRRVAAPANPNANAERKMMEDQEKAKRERERLAQIEKEKLRKQQADRAAEMKRREDMEAQKRRAEEQRKAEQKAIEQREARAREFAERQEAAQRNRQRHDYERNPISARQEPIQAKPITPPRGYSPVAGRQPVGKAQQQEEYEKQLALLRQQNAEERRLIAERKRIAENQVGRPDRVTDDGQARIEVVKDNGYKSKQQQQQEHEAKLAEIRRQNYEERRQIALKNKQQAESQMGRPTEVIDRSPHEQDYHQESASVDDYPHDQGSRERAEKKE